MNSKLKKYIFFASIYWRKKGGNYKRYAKNENNSSKIHCKFKTTMSIFRGDCNLPIFWENYKKKWANFENKQQIPFFEALIEISVFVKTILKKLKKLSKVAFLKKKDFFFSVSIDLVKTKCSKRDVFTRKMKIFDDHRVS